jgi:hypothetical protein
VAGYLDELDAEKREAVLVFWIKKMEPTKPESTTDDFIPEPAEAGHPDFLSAHVREVMDEDKLARMSEDRCFKKRDEIRRDGVRQLEYVAGRNVKSVAVASFVGENLETFELYFHYHAMLEYFSSLVPELQREGAMTEGDADVVDRFLRLIEKRAEFGDEAIGAGVGPQRLIAWLGKKVPESNLTNKLSLVARVERSYGIIRGLYRGFVIHNVMQKRDDESDEAFDARVERAVRSAGEVAKRIGANCAVEALPLGKFILEDQYTISRSEVRALDKDAEVNKLLERTKMSKEEGQRYLQAEQEKITSQNRRLREMELAAGGSPAARGPT